MATKKNTAPAVKAAPKPAYAPVSTVLTPYGAKAYRTPVRANQFKGTQGSAQEALVLDIDGTMQGWGGGLDKELEKWCAKHYKRNPDIVFLVVTARDHEYMYESSFNWCMRDFPYAFIGPFCRAADDPRLASEFKRQLAQGFEDMGLYTIVGAADDNQFVNDMWKHWKTTRNPAFDLLECDSYSGYADWRSGLSSKGKSYGSYTSYSPAAYTSYGSSTPEVTSPQAVERDTTREQTWVIGQLTDGKWVKAHWEDVKPLTVVAVEDISTSKAWAHYLAKRYGAPGKVKTKPDTWSGGLNVVSTSPRDVLTADEAQVSMAEVLAEIEDYLPELPTREDLEDIANHENPHWTPEYIVGLDDADLREACGITNGQWRNMLYEQIAGVFGSHCCDDELDELDLTDIEAMMEMTREEIEALLDRHYDERQLAERAMSLTGTDAMSEEERTRRQDRMDLEDLAVRLDSTLTLGQAMQLDSKELEARIIKIEAEGAALNAEEIIDAEVVA